MRWLQLRFDIDSTVLRPGADLTGGHSCSGRRGPWDAGAWWPGPRGHLSCNCKVL